MKIYKAQESVKKPLTALKKRNIKKQRIITIQNKINYHEIYNNRQCYKSYASSFNAAKY